MRKTSLIAERTISTLLTEVRFRCSFDLAVRHRLTHRDTPSYLCVTGPLKFFGLLVLLQGLAALNHKAALHLSPPRFSPSGLSTNQRGGWRQGGRTQQAFPGTQVVLLHGAVLIAFMAGTVHFVITGGQF